MYAALWEHIENNTLLCCTNGRVFMLNPALATKSLCCTSDQASFYVLACFETCVQQILRSGKIDCLFSLVHPGNSLVQASHFWLPVARLSNSQSFVWCHLLSSQTQAHK